MKVDGREVALELLQYSKEYSEYRIPDWCEHLTRMDPATRGTAMEGEVIRQLEREGVWARRGGRGSGYDLLVRGGIRVEVKFALRSLLDGGHRGRGVRDNTRFNFSPCVHAEDMFDVAVMVCCDRDAKDPDEGFDAWLATPGDVRRLAASARSGRAMVSRTRLACAPASPPRLTLSEGIAALANRARTGAGLPKPAQGQLFEELN